MSNRVFQALAKEKIEQLCKSYETSKAVFWDEDKNKLIHPGEYGEYREKAVKELLELFIPQSLRISEGFIISSNGDISTQCDIVIYDPNSCPKLTDSAHQKFFPVESVVAVGEVKSNITAIPELTGILGKLSKIKKMKENIKNPLPYRTSKYWEPNSQGNPFDQIFSFILCKNIPSMPTEGYLYPVGVEPRHRHNILIDIDNGHSCYEFKNGQVCYPQIINKVNTQVWRNQKNDEIPTNFSSFLTSLFNHCKDATLLGLDPVYYCTEDYQD